MKKYILSTFLSAWLAYGLAAGEDLIKAVIHIEGNNVENFLKEKAIPLEKCMMWHYPINSEEHILYAQAVREERIQGLISENPRPFTPPLSPARRPNFLNQIANDSRGIHSVAVLLASNIPPDKAPKCIIATLKEIEESVDCKVPTRIPSQFVEIRGIPIPHNKWLPQPSPSVRRDLLQELMLRYPGTIIIIDIGQSGIISRQLFQYVYSVVPTRQVYCATGPVTMPLDKMYKLVLKPSVPTRSKSIRRTPATPMSQSYSRQPQ